MTSYGVLGDGITEGWTGGTVERYNPKDPIDAYAVILNDSVVGSATYAFLSSEDDTTQIGDNGQAAYPFFDTSSSNVGANWYAVPEPTSGLLLLLGVAGLALRRRRA